MADSTSYGYGAGPYGVGPYGGGPVGETLAQNRDLADSLLNEISQFTSEQTVGELLDVANAVIENANLCAPLEELLIWSFFLSVVYVIKGELPSLDTVDNQK